KTEDMRLGGLSIYLCVSLQGGVDNEVALTAYITIALLEIPLPPARQTYPAGSVLPAEAAAGHKSLAVFDSNNWLPLSASCADGSVHWQRPGKEPEADLPYYRSRAPSAEVEMTAYVLLAHLTSQPAPAQEELSSASLIAKWISSQQNPNGGFSSTQ
ncbi:A2MG protein, partial [Rhadina sibilatrix]|nr:A2MG protein [Rhadina sibilatrix]